ncbi:MAG: D-2-hydroxyacid dehydrogenase family protein [Paraburkholderia fungorum]|nr:D-2-hydroxyacid dehydrogenase family protein [Paraburkholderia fungorum]
MTTRKDKDKNDVVLNRRDFLSTTTVAGIAMGLSKHASAQVETPAETQLLGNEARTNGEARIKVVVLDDYQDVVRRLASFSLLDQHDVTVYNDSVTDLDTLVERLRDAEAIVLIRERTWITDELLAQLPRLRLISQTSSGVRHVDVEACTRRGVLITVGTSGSLAPAELTWALIMASSRHLDTYSAELKRGTWQSAAGLGLGRVVRGRTLGIWGYGRIGKIVAGFGTAFGMNVMIWGSENSRGRAIDDGLLAAQSQEEFFSQADVVSIHLRLVEATQGIVTKADLTRMKHDALFVNTSRAGLVEPNALARSLRAGRPGFAAIDVFDDEPISDALHPLLSIDNVLATPHIGYVEQDNYESYFGTAFDNILAFLAEEPSNRMLR